MNILYFLTPKSDVALLYDNFTLRQAMERMESCTYTALPMLDAEGRYIGTVSEGDLLWQLKKQGFPDLRQVEKLHLRDVQRFNDNMPMRGDAAMEDLLASSLDQNFVPVVDDRGVFVGLVTRRSIIKYFLEAGPGPRPGVEK